MQKKDIKPPTTLGEAVRIVARLGGYLGRKHDGPPGHQIVWQGYTALQHMCVGYSLATENDYLWSCGDCG